MFYVYFILLDNGDVYKGFTGNLRRRWYEHQSGRVSSTKRYARKKLIGYETYLYESDARRREKFLKTTEGRRLLKQQYRDVIDSFDNGRFA